jgi:hypothetical protein
VASQEVLSSMHLYSYVPYHVQKCHPHECILDKMNTFTAVPHYFVKIYFNIILLSILYLVKALCYKPEGRGFDSR